MTSPAASPLQQVRSTRLAAMQSTVLANLQAKNVPSLHTLLQCCQRKGLHDIPRWLGLDLHQLSECHALACLCCRLVPLLDHADTGNRELTGALYRLHRFHRFLGHCDWRMESDIQLRGKVGALD